MPLCPQITNTPITVSLTADFTVTNVVPVLAANTEQLAATDANVAAAVADATAAAAAAASAQADATEALADAATAYAEAIGSLQPSADTIVNASNQMTAISANGITVYSGASASSGARVVLNSTGLAGFDSGGTASFSISASTGAAVFRGNITTGATITGGTLNIAGKTIIDGAGLLTGTDVTLTGDIRATAGYFGTVSNGFSINSTGLVGVGSGIIVGGTITTSSGNQAVILNGAANAVQFKSGGSVVANMLPLLVGGSTYGLLMHYNATPDPTGGTFPQMYIGSTNVSMFASNTIGVGISTSLGVSVSGAFNTDGAATFGATNSFQYLSGGTLRSLFTYSRQVTASTRALLIDSAGNIGNSTSTRRNKHEIKSYKIDSEALLKLDVKTFKYNLELSPEQSVQYGFIAEEAQELGLDELIQYDETGIPSYFSYEKLPIFLLQIVQELKAEIKQLKGE
jgi:hypothetical protein